MTRNPIGGYPPRLRLDALGFGRRNQGLASLLEAFEQSEATVLRWRRFHENSARVAETFRRLQETTGVREIPHLPWKSPPLTSKNRRLGREIPHPPTTGAGREQS